MFCHSNDPFHLFLTEDQMKASDWSESEDVRAAEVMIKAVF